MDQKTLVLIVTTATVVANLVFAFTGIPQTVTCTIAERFHAVAIAATGE